MEGKFIIYQVLARLWGSGHFSAWSKTSFDYLKSLGVSHVWLTGIPRHASGEDFVKGDPGSPYSICDWYDVNPYLADDASRRMDEFAGLVSRFHDAGLRCMIDFIPNHVARNYAGALPVLDRHDWDWTDTRKVNWSDSRTPEEMERILRYWAGLGVDGFRCDMVELVPADALGAVISSVRRNFPELIFVAEVYDRGNYRSYLEAAGFDYLYDKSGAYDILRGIQGGWKSARELTWNWQFLSWMQPRMLNFLENHDEQRLSSPAFAGSPDAAWAALGYSLLFNTAPFMIYAGQEAGEDAAESGDGRTSIFNWTKPRTLTDLWLGINGGRALTEHEAAVLARYRELCQTALSEPFRSGKVWDLCYCNVDSPGFNPDVHSTFLRYGGGRASLVFCNFSPLPCRVEVRIPKELRTDSGLDVEKKEAAASGHDFSIIELSA